MPRAPRIEYKYIVAVAFVFGMFMDLLDMTITNVALPTLTREFHTSTTTIEWVVTGYLLSLAIFIPFSGWAGDRFGTKRVFLFALATFTLGSLLCSFAWSAGALITFRILQGVGGGMMTPVGTAMLFRAFPPEERAAASAIIAIPAAVGPATGPVLGGYLVEYASWHWIFLINVPIGVLGFAIAALFLREERMPNPGRLDVAGFVLSGVGLSSLMYSLSQAGLKGFDNTEVLVTLLAGLLLLAVLVPVELRQARPMIEMRVFKDSLFSTTNGVQLIVMAGLAGTLFLLPLLLQSERGMTPLESGLTTFPQAIGLVLFMPVSGRLYPHIGPRRMMIAGLVVIALTTFYFCLVEVDTPAWYIRGNMLVRGSGFALVLVPLQAATFANISAELMGRASSVFNAIRQAGASLGVAILGSVLTDRLAYHHAQLGNPATVAGAISAFHEAFFAGGVLTLAGIAIALLVSDKAAAPTMAKERRARAAPAPAR